VIIRTKSGQSLTIERFASSFALTNMVRYGYTGLRSIQSRMGEREMRGIPAIHRAARLRSEAIASLRLYCWRGDGPMRGRVDTVWQAKLFRNRPNPVQTRFAFWETAEESLAYRNNAYIWKNLDGGKIVEWWALHPDQVGVNDDGTYTVQTSPGYVDPVGKGAGVYRNLGPDTILHIRGHGQGGQLVAPTPIEVFRDALAGPVGRQRHEARMWRRGTALQVALEFPANVSKESADQWRESWRSNYEGTEGETTAVVGGGAKITPIGMTLADATFVEMAQLTVMDASRIMGVPANLLGVSVQQRGTPNLEQDLMTWLRFGLGPELERIESALDSDDALFGTSALLRSETNASLGMYPGFDANGFVRGDLLTEATILQGFVQAGVLLPDEARHELGYEPYPDGIGQIPQITPVGGAPNAIPMKPLKPPADDPDDALAQRRAFFRQLSLAVQTKREMESIRGVARSAVDDYLASLKEDN
jgi:HK97 family phage portal protein